MNELYRGPWWLYFNFFLRTRKVTSRTYDRTTGKTKHTYDTVKTPYKRALDHPSIPEAAKAKLRAQYGTLDPMTLLADIEVLQDKLMKTLDSPTAAADSQLGKILK